jgi:hypothetical protein
LNLIWSVLVRDNTTACAVFSYCIDLELQSDPEKWFALEKYMHGSMMLEELRDLVHLTAQRRTAREEDEDQIARRRVRLFLGGNYGENTRSSSKTVYPANAQSSIDPKQYVLDRQSVPLN